VTRMSQRRRAIPYDRRYTLYPRILWTVQSIPREEKKKKERGESLAATRGPIALALHFRVSSREHPDHVFHDLVRHIRRERDDLHHVERPATMMSAGARGRAAT